MRRVVRRIKHLRLIGARAGLCGGRISELRTAWRILYQLVVVVCGLDIDPFGVPAVAVTIGIELGVEPDTRHRFHVDRIRGIICLKFETQTVDIAIPARSQILSRNRQFVLRYLIGGNHQYAVVCMSRLSGTGSRGNKGDIRNADCGPHHSRTGSIGHESLDFCAVVDIAEALVNLQIISRSHPQILACSKIPSACGGRKTKLSADRQSSSLIGIARGVTQLVLEKGNIHALRCNAIAGTFGRKAREIRGHIFAEDILIVELCLDRQFVIIRIAVLLAEGADRNCGARVFFRDILLHQR